jgi:spore maturation protein CgeB
MGEQQDLNVERKNPAGIKNAILVGIPYHHYVESIASAFEKSGIRVWYATNKFHHPIIKHLPLISGLLGRLVDNHHRKRLLSLIYRHADEADLLILWGIYIFRREDFVRIREKTNLRTIFWYIDSIYTFDKKLQIPEYFDYILCYNKEDADFLRQQGYRSMFVPLAYDPENYCPIGQLEKVYDLYFIGSLRKRMPALDKLSGELLKRDLKFRIDGPLSALFVLMNRFRYSNFMKCYSGKVLDHKDINRIYNQTRVCLNLQPAQATTGFSIRTYEIFGSGSIQLTNGNAELLRSIFGETDRICHFTDLEGLLDSLPGLLRKSDESVKHGPNGIDRESIRKHTFESRIIQILEFMEENS